MARTSDLEKFLCRSVVMVMGLVSVWALADVARSYPADFYPRFWDEAVYVTDVMTPGVLKAPDAQTLHYAPAKLGYGLPLSAATSVFGDRGAMYLSTLLWVVTIALTGWTTFRRFGVIAGAFTTGFLAYSPLFGKYVAEAGPTLLAALCFVLIWMLYQFNRSWLTGIAVGVLAFVDFKWAAPVGFALIVTELVAKRDRPLQKRLIGIATLGAAAIILLAVVALVHPVYREYLRNYILNHTGIVQFAPSGVFLFYLWLFGAAPAVIAAILGMTWCRLRQHLSDLGPDAQRAFLAAALIGGVPILFYSMISTLKALRFFAVLFPLMAVTAGVGISAIAAVFLENLGRLRATVARALALGFALVLALLVIAGSDGPAKHLRLPTGIPQALQSLDAIEGKTGTVSSYMWPVIQYGWRYPTPIPPFAMWGLLSSDKWLLLEPMLDRVTIESRLMLQPLDKISVDSLWTMRQLLATHLQPVLTTASGFYNSDYFLCESTAGGIPVLRHWQSLRGFLSDSFTVYKVDISRLPPVHPSE